MELDELHEGVNQSLSKDQNPAGTPGLGRGTNRQTRESAAQQRRETALRMGSLATAGHHAAAVARFEKAKRPFTGAEEVAAPKRGGPGQ
jgi:hypothetical protein